ncbi:hypothetical protein SUGI_0966180 [Cryptomeria japonica]|uniref:protein VACUOLELESS GAMETOPHYTES n=1 Tax=Cryptomeria japonica TaxID=3369 RepID=UPI002414B538|nr:protein VACUOLELESS GAMETOPHYTES [Cryptomeria japonica]GLJ45896.1 hypothetical protein SUGI_0966180 [Cryptomeria japonica]
MASTTSQQVDREGTLYNSRHEHNICSYEGLQPFTCSGCKEYGANFGFKCQLCPDFVMHKACAVIPDEYVHPFYSNSPLQFRPKTRLPCHHCNGCREVLRGFVFESPSHDLRLHPLCMALPKVLSYGGHKDHCLKLVVDQKEKFNCAQCSKSNSCWRFQCEETACRLWVDLNCAKVDFHGLSDVGISSIARRSRSRRVLEMLGRPSKFVLGKVIEGAVSGLVGAAIGLWLG